MRETIAFKATVEPRLMTAMTTPERKETTTALRGIFMPGETFGLRDACQQGTRAS